MTLMNDANKLQQDKSLPFGDTQMEDMWQDYIGPQNLPRLTNRLLDYLK